MAISHKDGFELGHIVDLSKQSDEQVLLIEKAVKQEEPCQDCLPNDPPGVHPGSRERLGRKSKAHRNKSERKTEKKMRKASQKRNRK